mmetsp:Transcript_82302/g.266448  ORF Transcript_82302/g.266448 Transcript_82302/m.266448 type:complete len:91 (-) Transcript_82302:44-316(-)
MSVTMLPCWSKKVRWRWSLTHCLSELRDGVMGVATMLSDVKSSASTAFDGVLMSLLNFSDEWKPQVFLQEVVCELSSSWDTGRFNGVVCL